MSYNVKDIDIKNHTYYFFNDIINMKNFDPNNMKIDEKSYKNQNTNTYKSNTYKSIVQILYTFFLVK